MIKYIIKLICCFLFVEIFLLSCSYSVTLLRDPFSVSQTDSCDELYQRSIVELSQWHYQGVIRTHLSGKEVIKMWFKHGELWQKVTLNDSTMFQPWQMVNTSYSEIKWQLNLPDYCQIMPLFIMKMKETK